MFDSTKGFGEDFANLDPEEQEYKEFINDMLATGANLLLAPAKVGKSWMALQLALRIATGMRFLGFESKQQDVLYITFDDTPQRIEKRMALLLNGERPPENLYFEFEAPTEFAKLNQLLDQYLAQHPGIKLVVIDPLQKVSCPEENGLNHSAIGILSRYAKEKNIRILLTCHATKSVNRECMFQNNSSMAAADTCWVISREDHREESAMLTVASGEMILDEFCICFIADSCTWRRVLIFDPTIGEFTDNPYAADKPLSRRYLYAD